MELYNLSFMVTKYKSDNNWIFYNWLNTENITISDSQHPLYKFLEEKKTSFTSFDVNGSYDDFNFLLEKHFISNNDEVLHQLVRKEYYKSVDIKSLGLTLMPVNQACNFECIYCHEDHTLNNYMGKEEETALKKFIGNWSPSKLRIDYFGGEPLLNAKFIISFSNSLKQLADKESIELESSSMTTNGYLLEVPLFKTLLALKITTYQITIDGLPEHHNKFRPLTNGEPTFVKIYENLLAIRNLDKDRYHFSITLRMNFNRETSSGENKSMFINKVNDDFGADKRFIIMFQGISNWKEESPKEELYCDKEDSIKIQTNLEKEMEEKGFDTVSMVLFSGPDSHSCYSSKPNNMVVYPFSQTTPKKMLVQKCTLSVKNPINNVGHINQDGEFEKNQNWNIWTSEHLFIEKKCQRCFFVLNCLGRSCGLINYQVGETICPKEKNEEVELAKRIIKFINQ